jgi:hypothetical protein
MTERYIQFDAEEHGAKGERLAKRERFDQAHRLQQRDFQVNISPFAGRLGGNGLVSLDRSASNEGLLKAIPDAAPLMTFTQVFDVRPFGTTDLWKAALIEGMSEDSVIHSLYST